MYCRISCRYIRIDATNLNSLVASFVAAGSCSKSAMFCIPRPKMLPVPGFRKRLHPGRQNEKATKSDACCSQHAMVCCNSGLDVFQTNEILPRNSKLDPNPRNHGPKAVFSDGWLFSWSKRTMPRSDSRGKSPKVGPLSW